jgi:hypothetical protein
LTSVEMILTPGPRGCRTACHPPSQILLNVSDAVSPEFRPRGIAFLAATVDSVTTFGLMMSESVLKGDEYCELRYRFVPRSLPSGMPRRCREPLQCEVPIQ